MDLDGDGRTDIISGSWPGDIYFFARRPDGTFAAGQKLKDRRGKVINVGAGATPFAADWDGDGAIDLLVGNVLGEVYLIRNESKGKSLQLGEPQRLLAEGQPIKVNGDAAPVAADWDGDGKLDLLVGAEDGSVVWYRNIGGAGAPKLAAARTLVGKSPVGWDDDSKRKPGGWGLRVKICVVDWNHSGRPDLVLGDRCGGYEAKPGQTDQELQEEKKAYDSLPELRKQWSEAYRDYRVAQTAAEKAGASEKAMKLKDTQRLLEKLTRCKDEIVAVENLQDRCKPTSQTHGFVWLFARKRAAPSQPPSRGP